MNAQSIVLTVVGVLVAMLLWRTGTHLNTILRGGAPAPRMSPWVRFGIPGLMLLGALGYCATRNPEDALKQARRVAANAVGSKLLPGLEHLGVAGREGLDIPGDLHAGHAAFEDQITRSGMIVLIDRGTLIGNPVYKRIAAAQPTGPNLMRAIGNASSALPFGGEKALVQHTSASPTAAIVLFGSLHGLGNPPIVETDSNIVRMTSAEAAEVAASLGADYIIAVAFVPLVLDFDPGNRPGFVVVSHRVRVFNAAGDVVLDKHNSVDMGKATSGGYLTVDAQLSIEQRAQMSAAKFALSFPTDEQRAVLTKIEKRLVSQTFVAEVHLAAREVLAIFR